MKFRKSLFRQASFHLFIFCLFSLIFGWPLIFIAGGIGFYSMFLYLFTSWTILIAVMILVQNSLSDNPELASEKDVGPDV